MERSNPARNPEMPRHRVAEACLATAQELDQAGYESDAIVQYKKARHFNPKLDVSRRLAVLYDRQGNDAKAAEEYTRAIKANPKDANLLNDFGYFEYQRGRFAESDKWLRQAIAIDPSHQRAWCNLAMSLAQQGRFDESYDAFAKVITPAEARSNIAMVMAQLGHTEMAKESIRLALAEDPDLKPAAALQALLVDAEKN
jgi:Tfp pilus assembly protein PilF